MKNTYALIGERLSHSHSVKIHNMLGNDGYSLIEVKPHELKSFIMHGDWTGLNVTIPYKRDVMKYCDVITTTALGVGSVNTLVRREGKITGDNTDVAGFLYMARRAEIKFEGKKVVILGSGGTSHTAEYCATLSGARECVIISRTGINNYENLSKHSDADIVVNTTPVGMYPDCGLSPVNLGAFPVCSGVIDVIYNPLKTAFLFEAAEKNIAYTDGLSMLVFQAMASNDIFFGTKTDEQKFEEIYSALRSELTNIVLIGMPGCGKSVTARELGILSGRRVIDTDIEIAALEGMSIPDIFSLHGEEYFRRAETVVLKNAGALSGVIIATGGGCVTRRENYIPLSENGRIYYIAADTDSLAMMGRPLSENREALKKMAKDREAAYIEFSDCTVPDFLPVRGTAEKIWRDFIENSCDKRTKY